MSISDEIITVRKAAEMLQCSMRNIRKLIGNGVIPAKKIGSRTWVVEKKEVVKYSKQEHDLGRPRQGFTTDNEK